MLLCEETASVLDMLKPKVELVEEACKCKYTMCLQLCFSEMPFSDCRCCSSFQHVQLRQLTYKLMCCNVFFFSALRVSTLMPSFCRLILDVGNFLNYVRTSTISFIFHLCWHLEGACIFNHRSTSREVTLGTQRGSRLALCSNLQKPRPTRAALHCFITSWRYKTGSLLS